jgi:NADP-dependent alcohol dehydrogenase
MNMNSFEWYNPTKIIFGEDSFEKISKEIPKNARILMTYGGGSIFKNGIYDAIKKQLDGFYVEEFGGIEPNPTYQTLKKAIELIKTNDLNFILAVGGGSVIDGTKFISAGVLFEGDSWDIPKKGIRVEKAMPFGTVLTLPATGSEMNSGAVITNKETGEKLGMGSPHLFPKFSICNPSVIKSLPKTQIQNGIIDAFTHVLEQYVTYPIGASLQDRISESILKTLIEITPKLLNEPYNVTTASNFMYSCTMALNGQIQKGVPTDWATHMIGHELTAHFNIDHARTLAIIMPNLYRVKFENKKEKLAQMAERVFNIEKTDTNFMAEKAIESLEAFYKQIEMPYKISDYSKEGKGISEKIKETFISRNWLGLGERKDISPDEVEKIVEMSL